MNDLTIVREFGELLDRGNAGLQPATRNRVLAVTTTEGTVVGASPRLSDRLGRRSPGRWAAGSPRRVLGSRLLLPMGAAVLVTVLAVSVIGLLRPTRPVSDPGRSSNKSTQILPSPAPDPTGFVYTRSRGSGWSDNWRQTKSGKIVKQTPKLSFGVREAWISVDGSQDGGEGIGGAPSSDFPGCRNGREKVTSGTRRCVSDPAYLPDFPITQAAIRARFHLHYPDTLHDDGEGVFDAIGETMIERQLPPAARAALFDMALHTANVARAPGESTLEGVSGVLLIQTRPNENQEELLFDGETDELLGRATIVRLPSGALGNPLSVGSWVQVVDEQAIVGKFGVRPDGTVADAAHRIAARGPSGS